MDSKSLIDRDVREALITAGIHPNRLLEAVPAVSRERITAVPGTGATIGVRDAVGAFKKERPEMFVSDYRDPTKTIEQIAAERDRNLRLRYGRMWSGY